MLIFKTHLILLEEEMDEKTKQTEAQESAFLKHLDKEVELDAQRTM